MSALKYWLRSGSFRFMRDRHRRGGVQSIVWNGKPLFYRPGTSDLTLIYRVLLKPENKKEYQFPALEPKTILDIGANIGVTAVLMAQRFPQGKVYAFEPVPENFEMLVRNTQGYPQIRCFDFALGAENAELSIRASDDDQNFGGFSFFSPGTHTAKTCRVVMKEVNSALAGIGVSHIDLIKIDTEGSEFPILKALSPQLLSGVQWITGELHGNQDFELLAYLSNSFAVGIQKKVHDRLSVFEAANKSGPS